MDQLLAGTLQFRIVMIQRNRTTDDTIGIFVTDDNLYFRRLGFPVVSIIHQHRMCQITILCVADIGLCQDHGNIGETVLILHVDSVIFVSSM